MLNHLKELLKSWLTPTETAAVILTIVLLLLGAMVYCLRLHNVL